MPEEFYDRDFPNLRRLGWEHTSDPDPSYRCLSFAIGETGKNWWPGDYHPWSPDYWPIADPQSETVAAFCEGLETVGFVPSDGSLEEGFDKIVLYVMNEQVTHAARQLDEQWWQSKLGMDEDVKHTIAGLEGPKFGKAACYLRRPRSSS